MKEGVKGQIAIAVCATFWSSAGLFIKILDWNPMVIAGLRSLIAALFLMALRPMRRRRGRYQKAPPRAFWAAAAAYALCMITFVVANKLAGAANAILLQYTSPVWAAIFGWVIAKEKPYPENWAATAVVFVGLLLFLREGLAMGSLPGIFIALSSGVLYGLHSVLLRMLEGGDPADAILCAHWLCFICSIPFLFLYPPVFTFRGIGAILFLGIIQIGIAALLFSYGIIRVRAVQAMLTAMVEPLLNPFWVFLATGEKPGFFTIIGGGIIISGVLASSLLSCRRNIQADK